MYYRGNYKIRDLVSRRDVEISERFRVFIKTFDGEKAIELFKNAPAELIEELNKFADKHFKGNVEVWFGKQNPVTKQVSFHTLPALDFSVDKPIGISNPVPYFDEEMDIEREYILLVY